LPVKCIAQEKTDDVKRAFQTANAGLLDSYFGSSVTLNIPGKELQCSGDEATEAMREFFANQKVRSFDIKFEGEKNNSNFIIGTLITDSGIYRVNIFFKKDSGNYHIHLLRIEKEHE
ncbi:MAG: DUF4783 domain-containing protein, partial [Bacteroidota bacterium]